MSENAVRASAGAAPHVAGQFRIARVVAVSLAVICAGILWTDWSVYELRASRLTRSHFPVALFLPFLVTATINVLLKRRDRRAGLSREELLTVLASGLAALSVAYDGLATELFGMLAAPFYFASAENAWGTYLHEFMPGWLVPQDTGGAISAFMDGEPWTADGALRLWATPVIWWTALVLALGFGMFCIVVILRKQWIDHERLSYPLVEVGRLMTETEPEGRLPAVFRSNLFWIGLGIVLALKGWNILSYFSVNLPRIPLEGGQVHFVPDFPSLIRRFSFYAIGFAYFAPLDVLFSIWSFTLLTSFEVFGFNRFGYKLGSANTLWTSTAIEWQSFGALMFLALWSLWMARRHLAQVWRSFVDGGGDDENELLPFRGAVLGLLGSMVFAGAWLKASGMPTLVIVAFLPLTVLTCIGISKVVAEVGLAYVFYTVQPYEAVLYTLGTNVVGPAGIASLTLMRSLNSAGKGLLMPAFAQAVRVVDRVVKPRHVTVVIWLSLALGIVLAFGDTIYFGHAYGGYNMMDGAMWNGPKAGYNQAVKNMKTPVDVWGEGRTMFAAIGFSAMALLTLVRYRARWWPLHPLGLAVQGSYGLTKTFFSVTIAWAAKSIVMRIGGVSAYEKGKPFFIGLLWGQAITTALVFLVDIIWFPERGHNVHNY